jgi:hypothetical protein
MSDSTRRSLRTILDVVPAVLASLLVLVPVLGLDAQTVAAVGGVMGAITVALTKLRNGLEDAWVIPALLKAPASDGADPLPPADPPYPPDLSGV